MNYPYSHRQRLNKQKRCIIRYTTKIGIPSWTPDFAAVDFAKSMAYVQMNAMIAEVKNRFHDDIVKETKDETK